MNLFQLLLFGAGGYLLYKGVTESAVVTSTPATNGDEGLPEPAAAPTPAEVAAAAAREALKYLPSAPGTISSDADREALTLRAALGETDSVQRSISAGIVYSADEWNWFRARAGGGETSVDLFDAANRGAKMNASEYLARRRAAGLSGLRGWR